jgi:outer membrane receptor for monomeric catechols
MKNLSLWSTTRLLFKMSLGGGCFYEQMSDTIDEVGVNDKFDCRWFCFARYSLFFNL